MTAFGPHLRLFSLYCSKGSHWAAALSAVTPDELFSWMHSVSFLVTVFSSLWMISLSPFCVLWAPQNTKGWKINNLHKKTQSLRNWQSVFKRTHHQPTKTEAPCDWLILQYKWNLQSATAAVNTSCSHALVASTLGYYSKELRFKPNCLHQYHNKVITQFIVYKFQKVANNCNLYTDISTSREWGNNLF